MNFREATRGARKTLSDRSPALLTALGVTGTVTTAYLAGTASFKAAELIREEQDWQDMQEKGYELELKHKFELVWRGYIPAVAVGTATIGCIVMSNRISSRRTAIMASAFAMSEKAATEYREKVVEKIGEAREQEVRDEIAQDQVRENPPVDPFDPESPLVRCYEPFTGRYFFSSVETLKKAMNDTNYIINSHGYASLSEFYNNAGIPTTSMSDELGWNSNKLMELMFSTVLTDDGEPCVSFSYQVEPIRSFYKVH